MSGKRVIFFTTGTKGDVIPFIAISIELEARGISALIAAEKEHRAIIEHHGISFYEVASSDASQDDILADPDSRRDIWWPSYRQTVSDYLNKSALDPKKTIIVTRGNALMPAICAMQLNCPYIIVHFQPSAVRQYVDAKSLRRHWQSLELRRCQIAAGAPPTLDLEPILRGAMATLSLFPSWFAESLEGQWPAGHMVGFPFIDGVYERDAHLEAFIERAGAPIVFAPGTGIRLVHEFAALAENACDILGMPGVFTSPYLNQCDGFTGNGRFLIRNHVDFRYLLGRAALLVHHGGIGTLAQATRSGVAQLVRPQYYDQPDNAERLVALNLAHQIDPAENDPHAMAMAIRNTLADTSLIRHAADRAIQVRSRNGAVIAAELIESQLKSMRGS